MPRIPKAARAKQKDKHRKKIDEELAEHKLKMEQLDKEFVERQQRVADRFKNLR